MPLIYTMDASIRLFEFKKMVIQLRTYSAWEGLKTLGFDCFRFLRVPGNDWNWSPALRMPLSGILISHFFLDFSVLVLLLTPASNLFLGLASFLMYD